MWGGTFLSPAKEKYPKESRPVGEKYFY